MSCWCHQHHWQSMLVLLYELPACLPTCKFGHISVLWNTQLREFHDSVDQNRMMDQGLTGIRASALLARGLVVLELGLVVPGSLRQRCGWVLYEYTYVCILDVA